MSDLRLVPCGAVHRARCWRQLGRVRNLTCSRLNSVWPNGTLKHPGWHIDQSVNPWGWWA
jgi:hypothetical protein